MIQLSTGLYYHMKYYEMLSMCFFYNLVTLKSHIFYRRQHKSGNWEGTRIVLSCTQFKYISQRLIIFLWEFAGPTRMSLSGTTQYFQSVFYRISAISDISWY